MQLLCGNTDLSTKPKLKAICKAGRGIVIDTGTVNAGKEQLFFSITFRNDGIRMVGAMLFNMIDRCQRVIHNPDIHDEIIVFRIKAVFLCRQNQITQCTAFWITIHGHSMFPHDCGNMGNVGSGNFFLHQQRLHRIAYRRALAFGIDNNSVCHLWLCRIFHIHMADAGTCFNDRHLCIGNHCLNQSSRSPGNQYINRLTCLHQGIRLFMRDRITQHDAVLTDAIVLQ